MTTEIVRGPHQAAGEGRCGDCDGSGILHVGWSRDIGVAVLPCAACGALHRTWYRWMAAACWSVSLPVLLLGMLLLF